MCTTNIISRDVNKYSIIARSDRSSTKIFLADYTRYEMKKIKSFYFLNAEDFGLQKKEQFIFSFFHPLVNTCSIGVPGVFLSG